MFYGSSLTSNWLSVDMNLCPQLFIDKIGIITLSFLCCYEDKHIKIHEVFIYISVIGARHCLKYILQLGLGVDYPQFFTLGCDCH